MSRTSVDRLARALRASQELIRLLGHNLTEEDTLRRALAILCQLVDARYGAVGLTGPTGNLVQFVHHGMTPEQAARIGAPPSGKGLLGVLIEEPQIIRLDDLTLDPRHSGFPAEHPPMRTFLGVPITGAGGVYGRLYLTEKRRRRTFTDGDVAIAAGFARSLGAVLESLRFARARSDFIAMLAHDIRTPLSVVLGYSEVLRLEAASHLSAEELAMVEAIEECAQRIMHLAQNFLLVSRIDAGKLHLALASCDLREIARKSVALHASIARTRRITLRLDAPQACPVVGNEEALGRVISNLIANAVAYSPPEETVEVTVGGDDSEAVVAVRDHGAGIRPEDRALLFERYARLGSTTPGSCGLGLYIVKVIVDAHGGTVSAESAPGRGSTFRFRLPRRIARSESDEPPASNGSSKEGGACAAAARRLES